MPWHVALSDSCPASKPWAVIKDSDGSVSGCHASQSGANDQMAALYASERGISTMEHRTVRHAIRAEPVDEKPGIAVRAIVPGIVDDYGSVWDAHAFDESLANRMPRLAWAHEWREPLGPPVSWEASDEGPLIRFHFSDFDAVPMAKRAHAQVMDGTIQDVSVGFSYMPDGKRLPTEADKQRWPGVKEVITRARLPEVSLVLEGAVPGAKVLAVRQAKLRTGALIDLEAVYQIAEDKASGKITDEQAKAAVDLLAQADSGPEPVSDEPDEPEPTAEELAAKAEAESKLDAAMADAEAVAMEALAE